MKRRCLAAAAAVAWISLVAGCVENTAPGNDREAELDPPEPPARMVSVGEAVSGVDAGLLKPRTMTEADLGSLPEIGERCRFRMTRVGFPVLAYGSSAVMKLNGKLVTLPATGEGRYGADGVEVSVGPLGERDDGAGPFEAELVVRLPGAPDELGFHGFSECRS